MNHNNNWKLAQLEGNRIFKQKCIVLKNEYYKNPKLCKKCNSVIPYEKKVNNFCNRKCSASFNTIGRILTDQQRKSISIGVNKYIESNEKPKNLITITCCICQKKFQVPYHQTQRKYCSTKCHIFDKQHGHLYCKKAGGGIRPNGGYGKSGWYKDYFCNSTYELVWVIYNLDHKIKFKRNTEGFRYTFENKDHLYFPDFVLDDGTYIEIKGFMRPHDYEKIKQFPYHIKVLMETDIKHCFNYVNQTYTKNYVTIYNMECQAELESATTRVEILNSTN